MKRLEQDLRAAVSGEVRFDAGSRALYATDSSNYRQAPIGVVTPRNADDVVAALEVCRWWSVPVLPRGAGTSLAGQRCNTAVVLDFSRHMNGLVELDPERRLARVQPGLVLDRLRDAAASHGLTFGPDPATHACCTLGGMIGNNACGVHSIMAGRTADNVEELEVLTYRGERLRLRSGGEGLPSGIEGNLRALRDRVGDLVRARFPRIPRRVSGYNLDELLPEHGFNVPRALVGSEGTCATVLEATVRLVPSPSARALVVLGYPDVYRAAESVLEIIGHGPIGLEGFDGVVVEGMRRKHLNTPYLRLLPDGAGWLLVEFGGDSPSEASERARSLTAALGREGASPDSAVFDDPAEQGRIWAVREACLGAMAHVPGEPDRWEGWDDAGLPPENLGAYLRDFQRLLDRYGYRGGFYGHFGDGCVHTRTDFDLTSRSGIARYRRFVEEAADLVVGYGGSLSGEHGDGQSRAELLPRMFGDELVSAFREFKAIWDPDGLMNPGKVVDPLPLDANLRLGPDYQPPASRTHFTFEADGGSFARAALRCVGVGKCRKTDAGIMCPSYMATGEERYSTRGRARLLFEMLNGELLRGGWRDEHVREALDLCLACKACKRECPANVDMAAYKAEFLSHYYRRRPRPAHMYATGLIARWARLGAAAPTLANQLARLGKGLIGVAPERALPTLAPETFRARFSRRQPEGGRERVLLWPDTFTNYFAPERGHAAVSVLEAAGFRVDLPGRVLCCGRPLYDAGLLDSARRALQRTVDELRADIRRGVPVVVLEPSCLAVFRDELGELLPRDEDARRLSRQALSLAEALTERPLPAQPLAADVLVHGHCHQQALWGMDADLRLLAALGANSRLLDSGCCGLAGGFGYHKDHHDVSLACAEHALAPAVRSAPRDTLVVCDGFSCSGQIQHTTGRRAMHLAEVVVQSFERSPPGERRQ
jgi:FAD/FMN-containing dehydrogenase/Fe-S oxidoreductase